MASQLNFPRLQFFNNSGAPLAGGALYTYAADGSTAKQTWQDLARTVPNSLPPTPITLDAAGRTPGPVFGDGAYVLVVKDSLGNTVYTGPSDDFVGQLATMWQGGTAPTAAQVGLVSLAGVWWHDTANKQIKVRNQANTAWMVFATLDETNNAIAPNLNVTYAGQYSGTPYPLTQPTLLGMNIQGLTTANSTSETGAAFSLESHHSGNKVALYAGNRAKAGSGPVWAQNLYLQFDTDSPNQFGHGLEIDLDNHSAYDLLGDGLNISTGGGRICGSAITIIGASSDASGAGADVGVSVGATAAKSAAYRDLSAATVSLDLRGTHSYGIDMELATYTTAAMKVPNNAALAWGYGGGNVYALNVDTSGNVQIGQLASGVYINNSSAFGPTADNAVGCGNSSHRWNAVWAVNGTIQTSDPSLKTGITPLDAGAVMSILSGINPVTFKWKEGGQAPVDVTADTLVQDEEDVTEEIEQIDLVNGQPILKKVSVTRKRPAVDYVPLLDESGQPVMETRPAVYENGKLIRAAETHPRTYAMPRMVKKAVSAKQLQVQPGKRTHWGWDASEVGAVFQKLGLDFGGFVKAEDGTLALRPDQFIPILWKVTQLLAARVDALEKAASHP